MEKVQRRKELRPSLDLESPTCPTDPFPAFTTCNRTVPLPAARGQFSEGKGWGIRRTVLHNALKERAEAVEQIRWGSTVTGLAENGLICNEELVEGDWIVGADGLGLKCEVGRAGRQSFQNQEIWHSPSLSCAPWSDNVEVYWAEGCEAQTLQKTRLAWLSSGTRTYKLNTDDLYAPFPALKEKLQTVRL